MPKCEHCEQDMELVQAPTIRFAFKIPFTDLEIQVMDWGARDWLCTPCAMEIDARKYERVYDAGGEAGYDKGFEDGLRATDR